MAENDLRDWYEKKKIKLTIHAFYTRIVERESAHASQDESKYTTYDFGVYFEGQMLPRFPLTS